MIKEEILQIIDTIENILEGIDLMTYDENIKEEFKKKTTKN